MLFFILKALDRLMLQLKLRVKRWKIDQLRNPTIYWRGFFTRKGNVTKALDLMEAHVINRTSEPETLFHIAKIYKANGKIKETQRLKKEFLSSVFELGPIIENEIKRI